MLQRIEASRWGRAAIAAGIAFLLLAQVVLHLPSGRAREELLPPTRRAVDALGVRLSWGLFAPDPRPFTLEIVGIVDLADGTSVEWEPPDGDPFVGYLRSYRWTQWVEFSQVGTDRAYFRPLARWLAERYDGGDSRVERVRILRRVRASVEPGSDGPEPVEQVEELFVLEVGS